LVGKEETNRVFEEVDKLPSKQQQSTASDRFSTSKTEGRHPEKTQ